MKEDEKFDWYDYYLLAESFQSGNPAKLRTGINRYYYSSFLKSRDYLIENKIFLNKKSKDIMTNKSSQVHDETRNIFRNHNLLNTSRKGEIIASELHELRKYRNMVDYDAENPKNIKFAYRYCKSRAKIVLDLLEELN